MHPPRANRAYRNIARVLRPTLSAITRRDWRGTEHLPSGTGFIAASNHMSNVDPITFAHYLYDNGVAPKILAKSSLFTVPVLGWMLRTSGQIPVYRNTAQARDSLRAAEAALAEQDCVAMFPEGTLTRDPDLWPMAAKSGVARLALTTRVPVVPIAQWGAQHLLGRYQKMFRPFPPKRITIVAGPPVDLSDLYDRPQDATTLREATERVMAAITALLADIRGETPPEQVYDMRRPDNGAAASALPSDSAAPAAPAVPAAPAAPGAPVDPGAPPRPASADPA